MLIKISILIIKNFSLQVSQQTSGEVHTYIDLKQNKHFSCDCDVILQYRKHISIQLLNECMEEEAFQRQCFAKERQSMASLNRKFRAVFGVILLLLLVLTTVLIYYMCSDCIKNMQPYERISYVVRQFFCRFRSKLAVDSDAVGASGHIRQSKVIYSKLDNEAHASNVNLDIWVLSCFWNLIYIYFFTV